RSEPFSGILVRYDAETVLSTQADQAMAKSPQASQPLLPQVGFIGAGNFAQNMLLPKLKGICELAAVAAAQGVQSRDVADKYGFAACYASGDELLQDERVNTVFIVTRHHTHGEFVLKALATGKHVFVEKPLAMTLDELEEIRRSYVLLPQELKLMVGFNRRFAPAILEAEKLFAAEQKKAILIRVNAGALPPDHWTNDPEIGGGRIIGEACHFVDLAMALAKSPIVSVTAEAVDDGAKLRDSLTINLAFADGSIASVVYLTNGNQSLAKEHIEIHSSGVSAVIHDFREMTIHGKSSRRIRFKGQDKGHAEELRRFIAAVKDGLPNPIPFAESYCSMKATFLSLESLRTGRRLLVRR
ncbi:MAG: gfo/Idh/MocA family oxidoreductase, partial [Calditrichaeota bacterium]